MRTPRLRLAFALLALGLVAGVLSVTREVAAQKFQAVQVQPAPPVAVAVDGPVGPDDPKKPQTFDKMNFPESRTASLQFEAVGDYLKQEKNPEKWATVCDLAQRLLEAKSDFFYQYPDGDKRRVSIKHEVENLIGKFPKEGMDFYQLRQGQSAEAALKAAKEGGYDKGKVAEVSQRYFYTKSGVEASLLLAAMNLEAGNYIEAAYGYQRLLARPDADALLDPKGLFKAAVALKRTGDARQTETAIALWGRLEKAFPREGLVLGRKGYTLEALKAEFDRPVQLAYGGVGGQYVAMRGGDATRAATADAGTPFLGHIYSTPVVYNVDGDSKPGADWVKQAIDKAYKDAITNTQAKRVIIPAGFPVTAQNLIVFRGYDGTYAYYTKDCTDADGKPHAAGELAWISPSEGGAQAVFAADTGSTTAAKQAMQQWWNSYWSGHLPSVLFENPLTGTLSHDGKYAYYVDDLSVPPASIQMNEYGGGFPSTPGSGEGPRSGLKDFNQLKAVELDTGRVGWSLGSIGAAVLKGDEDDKAANAFEMTDGGFFLGAPLVLNGKLYVLFERDGFLKMACLDPYKTKVVPPPPGQPAARPAAAAPRTPCPDLLWVQSLGRANKSVRQDAFRRIQGLFPAVSDGVIVCPTNSGAVVAVDLNARSLLWAHTYSTAPKGGEVGGGGPGMGFGRGGFGGEMPGAGVGVPSERWRSSAPAIVGGRVVLTAYDSDHLQCVDLRTGKLLWSDARRADDLYVGGVQNGNVIVVGRTAVRAVKLVGEADAKTGREKVTAAWKAELKIGTPCGHGVAGKNGLFYLPIVGDPDKKDDRTPAVWAVNADTGLAQGKTPYRRKELGPNGVVADPRLSLGNLVFHDGRMYSQSATEVAAFPLIEVKKREMDELLAKNPNDPDGLFSRGELQLEDGKLTEAVADLKKAETNKPGEATARRIHQKLYTAYTEILRSRFGDGEGFLEEYKALCDTAPTSEQGTPDYAREADEQTRRRGLFYCLVADGREKQGRLVEAFDNYRAYAELGEQGKLLPVPEDPNTLALSGVWASGRIDAMMRNAKDPAARKPLEDKVAKEWEEVRGANDLDRLRKFVRVFGPYFAAGLDAQFLLADRLTGTNNDDDRREAEGYLLNLLARAEEDKRPDTAARATDALARLLTSRGLMDDAVGMYARLGARYPAAAVRGDKTGADVYGDLVTDKRYLPYLEAPRGPSMGRYVVKGETTGLNKGPSIGYAPDGEQLPYFTRHRVSLDVDQSTGLCTLKVTDRITGEEKFKVPGLPNLQQLGWNGNNQGGFASQKVVQANGHLLMVHLNQTVYCYDLTKGKDAELWKVNLFGGGAANTNQQFPQLDYNNQDGDMILGLPDQTGSGQLLWAFRLGKSAVLQSAYACVLTRDGLVAKDPRTGTTLWTRTVVANRASVFGDSRHIYLVEPSANGGVTTRVLRAVDGVQVDGVPEFGKLFTGPNRLAQFGRQLLLFEPDGKGKALRLYDVLDGKDVWTKACPADAVPLDSADPELTGYVAADGKVEVLASRTGKPVLSAQVDADRVKTDVLDDKGKLALVKPVLAADAERVYVVLNKEYRNNTGITPENYAGPAPMKVKAVNGTLYAFDRAGGKRLWFAETHFLNQRLCLEQFDALPCLVAFNPSHVAEQPNAGAGLQPGGGPVPAGWGGPGGIGQSHLVVAVDKKTGVLKLQKTFQPNQWMTALEYKAKDGSFELGSYAGKVTIKPEEVKK